MKKNVRKNGFLSVGFILLFIVWTALIQCVDVRPLGQQGTDIGFAGFNTLFHTLTGVHMGLYTLTDWLGLVPIFICMGFAFLGLYQLIKRRSLFKVDADILILGFYYILVIFAYLIFEMIPINYRPVLIDGFLEASYPSSTTLLVLSVMPTLSEQIARRVTDLSVKRIVKVVCIMFSLFMVLGRLVSGVHWFTDIAGAIFLSAGLFYGYKACVCLALKPRD